MRKTMLFLMAAGLFVCGQNPERSPQGSIHNMKSLFNGKNLDGWYTWQRRPETDSKVPGLAMDDKGNYTEAIGLNRDPLQVFTVVTQDGAPAIRISGEVFGILVTKEEFENFHLKLEFKWGQLKNPPRKNDKRDSGILYHSIGPEGAWGGVWMKSFECQVQEGDCGDFIVVDTTLATIRASRNDPKERYTYQPAAEPVDFSVSNGYCVKNADYERPTGEWNTIEIYSARGRSIHVVNGHVNMRTNNLRMMVIGKEVPLVKGKIQLQSEGAEIFYRNIQIEEISEIPQDLL